MAILLCFCTAVSAQSTLKTGYFMDRMSMRHEFNPAFSNEQGYFAIPALGDINFGVNSTMSLDDFLFPLESGELGLFAHPDVDQSAFLSNLNQDNLINQDLSLSILSLGFHGFGGYNTFDVSVRENFGINIQKSLFEFMVGANDNGVYDMSGTSIDLTSWIETSIGHSHRINENITAGIKLKYLIGAANASLTVDQMQFESSEEQVMVGFHTTGTVAAAGMQLNGSFSDLAFDTFDFASVSNSGFAVDLGATYEMDDFTFALALTDLGFIRWSAPSTVSMGAETTFTGFNDLDLNDFSGSTEDQLEELMDPFTDLGDSMELTSTDAYSTWLAANLNMSAQYDIFDCLSVGAIYTATFSSVTTHELMGVVTYTPAKWFSIALSGTTSTYGTYWGWALNYSPHYFLNFFVGSDCMVTKVTPQFIPYSSTNLNLKFGLSIPFGHRHTAN